MNREIKNILLGALGAIFVCILWGITAHFTSFESVALSALGLIYATIVFKKN